MTERFKILKITLFISIVVLLIVLLSGAVDPSKTDAGTDKIDKVICEVDNEKENSIDVIVLGDSEAYASISPFEMYQDYGFTTFVAASPAQKAYQSLDMLTYMLKRQSPKVCILETNLVFRDYSIFSTLIPKFERTFPIFKYHNIWKSIFDPDYSYIEITESSFKGYRYSDIIKPASTENYMAPTPELKDIKFENINYIKKIQTLCEENGIQLLFVSAPSTKNWDYTKHNAVKELSVENDINYIDFNLEDSIKIDWSKDTYDKGDHLNYSGAKKVTSYLGKYLNSNYDLPDHRNDDYYSSWDKLLEIYIKKVR